MAGLDVPEYLRLEPHSLEPEDFLAEVRSFEFWFQAVEGYLTDRPLGMPRAERPNLGRDYLSAMERLGFAK